MALTPLQKPSGTDHALQNILAQLNIANRTKKNWYNSFSRYGVLDPYNSLSTTKEYLFFTKPDLNLSEIGKPGTLQPQLKNNPFFIDILNRYPEIIKQLQKSSVGMKNSGYTPFMPLLSNAVTSTLDLPSIETTFIDNSKTIYGSSIDYRGDGFNADEDHTFTLEMDDTKYLDVYNLLKTYEEYERLKKVGRICPPNIDQVSSNGVMDVYNNPVVYSYYIRKRILHDQFSIYKFVVDDDMETLIYWAHLKGVTFTNVPREAFSENLSGDLKYTVGFKAQFVDDMRPSILAEFNNLVRTEVSGAGWASNITDPDSKQILQPIMNYNNLEKVRGNLDYWPNIPYIYKVNNTYNSETWNWPADMKYKYQLKWRLI